MLDWTPGQGFPDWRLRQVIVFCSLLSQCLVFVFREMKVQVTMENQDMMVQSHTVKVSNHDQHYNEFGFEMVDNTVNCHHQCV